MAFFILFVKRRYANDLEDFNDILLVNIYFDIRKNPGNVMAYIRHFSKSYFTSTCDCKTNMLGFLVFGISLMYSVSDFLSS